MHDKVITNFVGCLNSYIIERIELYAQPLLNYATSLILSSGQLPQRNRVRWNGLRQLVLIIWIL